MKKQTRQIASFLLLTCLAYGCSQSAVPNPPPIEDAAGLRALLSDGNKVTSLQPNAYGQIILPVHLFDHHEPFSNAELSDAQRLLASQKLKLSPLAPMQKKLIPALAKARGSDEGPLPQLILPSGNGQALMTFNLTQNQSEFAATQVMRMGPLGAPERVDLPAPTVIRGENANGDQFFAISAPGYFKGTFRAKDSAQVTDIVPMKTVDDDADPAEFLLISHNDTSAENKTCGVTDPAPKDEATVGHSQGGGAPETVGGPIPRAEVVIYTDARLQQDYYGNYLNLVYDTQLLFTISNAIFQRDQQLDLHLKYLFLDPVDQFPTINGDGQTLLSSFRSFWRNHYYLQTIEKNLTYFLTSRDLGPTMAGVAYLPFSSPLGPFVSPSRGVCVTNLGHVDGNYGLGLMERNHSNQFSFFTSAIVMTHEFGHNLGADHCDGYGEPTCRIMMGNTRSNDPNFGTPSITVIQNRIQSSQGSCLQQGRSTGEILPFISEDFSSVTSIDQNIWQDSGRAEFTTLQNGLGQALALRGQYLTSQPASFIQTHRVMPMAEPYEFGFQRPYFMLEVTNDGPPTGNPPQLGVRSYDPLLLAQGNAWGIFSDDRFNISSTAPAHYQVVSGLLPEIPQAGAQILFQNKITTGLNSNDIAIRKLSVWSRYNTLREQIPPSPPPIVIGKIAGGVGDINNDGFDDHLESFYNYATLHLGGGNSRTLNMPITTCQSTGCRFGGSVAALGDISGDGMDDFVVGTDSYERAFVYTGSTSGNPTLVLTVAPTPLEARNPIGFAFKVRAIKDIDGDGKRDFIVSAPQGKNTQGQTTGFVRALSSVTGAVLWTQYGDNPVDFLGSDLATSSDGEMIVAGVRDNRMFGGLGYARVYRADGTLVGTLRSTTPQDGFGKSVAIEKKWRNANYAIAVGVANRNNLGEVQVFNESLQQIVSLQSFSNLSNRWGFGTEVRFVGDLSGSGGPSLVIASDNGDPEIFDSWGSVIGMIPRHPTHEQFGCSRYNSIGSVGDYNGDGYTDLFAQNGCQRIVSHPRRPINTAMTIAGGSGSHSQGSSLRPKISVLTTFREKSQQQFQLKGAVPLAPGFLVFGTGLLPASQRPSAALGLHQLVEPLAIYPFTTSQSGDHAMNWIIPGALPAHIYVQSFVFDPAEPNSILASNILQVW